MYLDVYTYLFLCNEIFTAEIVTIRAFAPKIKTN